MTEKPMPEADLHEAEEEIAAEYLLHAGEVALGDRCDELDRFSDAALADQLVTEWAKRIGKPEFEQLVEALQSCAARAFARASL